MNVMAKPAGTELVLTRELKAPRERVFAAWIDARQASLWWVPRDFTPLSCEMDVQPGGIWRRRMRSPSGDVILKHGVYREVSAPERLVFTYITENAAGIVDPETLVSIDLTDLGGGRTRLTLWHTAFETEVSRNDHRGGWAGCLERFANYIDKVRPTEGVMTMNIQPYLSFEGKAQEAIDFYKGAIGAEVKVVMHFKDAPPEAQAQMSPGVGDKVMHACIKIGESDVFVSDGRCGGKASFSGVTLTLNTTSDGEADKLFAALGKGGQVTMPMAETFFATRFGMLADKFGVNWMVLNPKN